MLIWTNPISFKHALKLLTNPHLDVLIVGSNKFNICNSFDLRDQQLTKLIKNKSNKKIVVSLNKIFHEDEIDNLKKYLKTLKNKKIDGIIFQDFGVKQICDELNLKTTFIYCGNSLVVNYGQLSFYKDNNIKIVQLSNELFLNEVKQMQDNKNGVHLLMQVEGYTMLTQSKWKLLSAFKRQKKIEQSLVDQPLLLKEELRKNMNIILEDNHGTYLFNGYNTSCLEMMKDLKDLDSLFINGFMHDQTWVDSTINIYYQLLNKKTNLKNLIEFRNKINKTTTNGFLNAPKGLLNLQTTNNEK